MAQLPDSDVAKHVHRVVVVTDNDRMSVADERRVVDLNHVVWHDVSDVEIARV